MSNRQWLNPLISMAATIIMCVLLAISQSRELSPTCTSEVKHKIEVIKNR
jgi:hypothetical protein